MTKEQRLNGVIALCLIQGVRWKSLEEGLQYWRDLYYEFDKFSGTKYIELPWRRRSSWYSSDIPGNVQLVAQGSHEYHYAAAALFLLIKKYPKKYAKYQHLIARLNEIGDELTSGIK